MEEKIRQLDMMSSIYSCAVVTIIALTGRHANAGLPGVSGPRLAQVKESINGCVLFTNPQHVTLEEKAATYSSRAWTLQEDLLSRRKLIFTKSLVSFGCLLSKVDEGMDVNTFPSKSPPQHPVQPAMHLIYSQNSVSFTIKCL